MALSATYLKWTPAFLVVESMPICLYGIFRNTYNRKFYYNESYMGSYICYITFAEDHDDQNGPCLESVACTNPELRKQTFGTSERE